MHHAALAITNRIIAVCALASLVVGCVTLLGWLLDIRLAKTALPGLVVMKANAAMAFIAAGAALWLLLLPPGAARTASRTLAWVVLSIGALTILEHIAEIDLGIDQLVFADPVAEPAGAPPGRMGVDSALGLAFVGLALLFARRDARAARIAAHVCALGAITIGWIALVGHAYSVRSLNAFASDSQTSLHGALALVALGVGSASTDGRTGLVGVLTSSGEGGILARQLMPYVLIGPFVLGWIRLLGQRAGFYSTEGGIALVASASAAFFAIVLSIYAARLDRSGQGRESAERSLRESDEFSRQIIANADEGIVVVDRELLVLVWNPFMQRLFGIKSQDVIGRKIGEVVKGGSEKRLEAIRRTLAGEHVRYEVERLMPSGDCRWLSATYTPMRDAAGNVIAAIATIHDLTNRKRTEDELRDSQARMTMALAAAGMGAWEIDPRTGRIMWTQNVAELLGRPRTVLTGPFEDAVGYVHPADRASVRSTMQAAMASNSDFAAEFRVTHPDGSERWLSAVGRMTGESAGAPRLVGVMTDITARRLLETQFREAQKMEGLGQLAGGVAHDFNNLLTAVLGFAEMLREDPSPDVRDRCVDEIVKAGTRGTALTRQLLAFSRRQVFETVVLDLDAVVSDLLGMLRRLIGEHIDLVTSLGQHVDSVRADRGQLEQVIVNLAVNARDAMPNGGVLRIETANTVLEQGTLAHRVAVRPGPYVMLAVSDTGTGMSEETKARIFEPFFTTKPAGRGTGLGLATVYGIVTQSNGYVWVYSELGHGTTFKIYLPRAEQRVAVAPAGAAVNRRAPIDPTRHSVLVVEDEESVRSLACTILRNAGYRVFAVGTPSEALTRFREVGGVDVLVTDVVMPGGRGTDLFRSLANAHSSLRVLFMSGYTDDSVLDQGHLERGMAFMQKPFSTHTLLDKIEALLEASSA